MSTNKLMKKIMTVTITLLLALTLAACGKGQESSPDQKDKNQQKNTESGKSENTASDNSGEEQGGGSSSDDSQEEDGKLGFRNVNYQVLNPDWTDSDHLAVIDTESWNDGRGVIVLDFGAGSNITQEAGIQDIHKNNSYGVFGSVFQNSGDLFYLTYVSGNKIEMVIAKPDMWVTIEMESDDELFYEEETSQVVPASNGHYDIVMPEDAYNGEPRFWALIYPTNGSWPLAVKIQGVGSLEKAEEYFAYIEEHTGNYRLSEKYQLDTAQDQNGNAVDLTAYAFYTDLLSLDVANRFGINFKETKNIQYTSRNKVMIRCSDGNWREVEFTEYNRPSDTDKPVDFMGYEMYYLSDKYLCLKYGENQAISFDIRHSIDSEEERKAWLEKEFFSSYIPEN